MNRYTAQHYYKSYIYNYNLHDIIIIKNNNNRYRYYVGFLVLDCNNKWYIIYRLYSIISYKALLL